MRPSPSSSAIARAAGRPSRWPPPIPTLPGRWSSTAPRWPIGRAGSAKIRCATTAAFSAASCPRSIFSDLGDGEFDGANLVANFEMLNPGRNFFGKYYDLFASPERVKHSFLDFERWWGGYHFMNEAEIHWIVEQLFVGNRLSRGEAISRARPAARPQGDPLADHRVRQLGRQHHAAPAGAQLDRRHLYRRA